MNGTYEIYELDILAECSRLNPHTGEVDVFDSKWLSSAAERAAQRQAEGYLAPVHVGQQDPICEEDPPFAGFLRNLRVFGKDPAVLYATVTAIPEAVFARIRAKQLPYRSVGVTSHDDPEINSLALLDIER